MSGHFQAEEAAMTLHLLATQQQKAALECFLRPINWQWNSALSSKLDRIIQRLEAHA